MVGTNVVKLIVMCSDLKVKTSGSAISHSQFLVGKGVLQLIPAEYDFVSVKG